MGSEGDTDKLLPVDRRRYRRLPELRPRFVTDGSVLLSTSRMVIHRYGMGVEMDCPAHGEVHRLTLWLLNPNDGGVPKAGEDRYYYRTGDSIEDLTLTLGNRDWDTVEIAGHWTGQIIHGHVIDGFPMDG